jgi:dolichyl-phosphate-mannose--protein O-mannosyl transferase
MSSDSSDGSPILPTVLESGHKRFLITFHAVTRFLNNIFPDRKVPPLTLDGVDAVAILFLTALGMITRIFRIQYPPYVVFDEVYFGNFTNWYLTGHYFVDIHPPLAKLIMAAVAHYAGYKADMNFELLGSEKRYPGMDYIPLRLTPAFFGALCVPLTYLAMRSMLASHFASFVTALFIASDLMLIVEARHILSDGILHCFSCLAIFSIFLYERFNNLIFLVVEGVCLGCVAACKYTSGGIVLLALIRQFSLVNFDALMRVLVGSAIRCSFLGLIVLLIHLACYAVHLTFLPYEPDTPFSGPDCVRQGLVDRMNPDWNKRANAPSVIRRIVALALDMHSGNMAIGSNHSYGSKWTSWPLFTGKWLLFWTKDGKHILCLGNVLLWWPVFFGICANLVRVLLCGDLASESSGLLIGYWLSYLPFGLLTRDVFLYHYAIPLIFGCANLGLLLDRELSPMAKGFCLAMFGSMAVLGFFFWCPWAYGLTTPDFSFWVWNPAWT